jgi:transcriptional regulator with XRE-family HTH domain
MRTFGDRLKKLRTDLELSQQQLAKALGVSQRAISSLEQIPDRLPSADTLRKLAAYFQVDAEWLVTGKGQQTPISTLTAEESELLLMFRAISSAGRAYVVGRTQDVYRDEYERANRESPELPKPGDASHPTKSKRLN